MRRHHSKLLAELRNRTIVALIVLTGLVIAGVGLAHAAEIIPSVGLTRAVDGDSDGRVYAGLAFRGDLAPFLKPEIGVAYRSESMFDDQLRVRMWPVTASLWLTPVPSLYAGAGVGWYNVTFDYDEDLVALPIEDETRQEFGVHVGGGVRVPLTTAAALDLNGRYVMMREQESRLVPEQFDPDFWTASLGLAIGF